ncbi:MAG TPA: hypothetical protein VE783_05300 [Candidatus Limnocylindrales bacterium]|nr:hypothetical protein [Candidatus Limnocylindrales bacterium]
MRWPWIVVTAAVLEGVVGLALLGTAAVMVVAARTAASLDFAEGTAAGILGAIGLVVLTSCAGMLKRKSWGWWLAEAANLVGLVVFVWDPLTRRVPDTDEVAFIVLLGVLLLVLLLAPVRDSFLQKKENVAVTNAKT